MLARYTLFDATLCLGGSLLAHRNGNADGATERNAFAEADPVPTPGVIALSPASFAFTATGASHAQTVNVSQSNDGGAFTASTTTCSGTATIASASRAQR
jgi:hypothetical protein